MRPLFFVSGVLAGAAAVLAARRLVPLLADLDVVEVHGTSMAPTLLPGELLLVEAATYRRRAPGHGELVLAADPRAPERELVKRVHAVADGRVELHGDADGASTDSRAFGDLPLGAVRWRVAFRYWPPSRVGVVR